METPPTPIWNGLEVAKLIVAALTPLVVIAIGMWINRSLKKLDYLQWTNQKITEKRLAIFDKLAPSLNDLLCYFIFVGCWKELTPPQIIERKREMDRTVYVNAALFSKEFITNYDEFMKVCYETYTGWGRDARLRTVLERRKKAAGEKWVNEWNGCFSDESKVSDPDVVKSKYEILMSSFSTELGVGLSSDQVPSGRIPANIR